MARAQARIYVGSQSAHSRWLAVNLSAVMPGWGQIYGGAWLKGAGFAIATLILISCIFYGIFMPNGNTLWGLWGLLPLGILYLSSLWDSHRTRTHLKAPTIRQDPWYPVFLSHVLPGMGQLYLQQALWGGLFLLLSITCGFLANFHPALLPVPPLIWALSCLHAYLAAAKARRWGILWLFLVALMALRLSVGSVPVMVRQAVEQCIVPSQSMLPTLQVNDRILVNKLSQYQPRLQDIIVFYAPPKAVGLGQLQSGDLVVKRVLGLPGQEVAIRDAQVWIDGTPLAEPYLNQPITYQWGPQSVPANQLFVLGDNRNSSSDSHVWGFLPQSLVIGEAYKIYWPPGRIRPLP